MAEDLGRASSINSGSLRDPTRRALEYSLELVSDSARVIVLDFLETKCALSLYNDVGELSHEQVESALTAFFGSGANLLMERYEAFLLRLHESSSATILPSAASSSASPSEQSSVNEQEEQEENATSGHT